MAQILLLCACMHAFTISKKKQFIVFKRVRRVPRKVAPNVPSVWQNVIVRFVPRMYHKKEESTDLEQGEGQNELKCGHPDLEWKTPSTVMHKRPNVDVFVFGCTKMR